MALFDTLTDLMSVAPAVLGDDDLMRGQQELARARQAIETREAAFAAEVAFRSRRELGHSGLAARLGARSPERLLQELTGASGAASRRLVRVGTLIESAREPAPSEPWLVPVLTSGLPIDAIDVIRSGLGMPGPAVTPQQLTTAAGELAALAATLPVDELAARARELRDDLDAEGVALREQEMRSQRYLRRHVRPDGMTKLDGLLDPLSDATLLAALDAATTPRRTPHFPVTGADDGDVSDVAQIPDDRTTEQRALDTLIELIDVGIRHPKTTLLGPRRPTVQLLVTAGDLTTGIGFGYLQGTGHRVSLDTINAQLCDSGLTPILFDSCGQPMDVGRAQRLHTAAQREAIIARDDGCIIHGCDRPPSRTEIHHIIPWSRGGKTSVDDGVCLCRYHHMMVHNNNWHINRDGADYFVVPPPSVDLHQVPRPVKKSPAVRRLVRQTG